MLSSHPSQIDPRETDGKELSFLCNVCGTANGFADLLGGGNCSNCGAAWRTVELAAGILSEGGRGCHVFLNRIVDDPSLRRLKILDLSCDAALFRTLGSMSGYRWGVPFVGASGPGGGGVRKRVDLARLPFGEDRFDLIAVRDCLCVVPDLGQFLRECFRVLAADGAVIFQDRYPWPLPEEHKEEATGSTIRFRMPQPQLGSPASVDLPQIRQVGAAILGELAAVGFVARVERVGWVMDPLYRQGLVIGVKP